MSAPATHPHLVDSTLNAGAARDGVRFSKEDRLAITEKLGELGLPFLAIGAVQADEDFQALATAAPQTALIISAEAPQNDSPVINKDFNAALRHNPPVLAVHCSAPSANPEQTASAIRYAKEAGTSQAWLVLD